MKYKLGDIVRLRSAQIDGDCSSMTVLEVKPATDKMADRYGLILQRGAEFVTVELPEYALCDAYPAKHVAKRVGAATVPVLRPVDWDKRHAELMQGVEKNDQSAAVQ